MPTCPDCGSIIMEGDPYCTHCGAHLKWGEDTTLRKGMVMNWTTCSIASSSTMKIFKFLIR